MSDLTFSNARRDVRRTSGPFFAACFSTPSTAISPRSPSSLPPSPKPVGSPFPRSILVDWDALVTQFDGKLRFVEGSATDIAALREAGADTADRILLMPYATWQDYRVRRG